MGSFGSYMYVHIIHACVCVCVRLCNFRWFAALNDAAAFAFDALFFFLLCAYDSSFSIRYACGTFIIFSICYILWIGHHLTHHDHRLLMISVSRLIYLFLFYLPTSFLFGRFIPLPTWEIHSECMMIDRLKTTDQIKWSLIDIAHFLFTIFFFPFLFFSLTRIFMLVWVCW